MASIQNLRLTLISHDHDRKVATVRVSYIARLTAVERQLAGLRFREKIQLWGSDSPDADDFCTSLRPRRSREKAMASSTDRARSRSPMTSSMRTAGSAPRMRSTHASG